MRHRLEEERSDLEEEEWRDGEDGRRARRKKKGEEEEEGRGGCGVKERNECGRQECRER